ncbi:hypothetical protein DMP17_08285 [Pseudonocardia sp. TMWB2A]|uniref:endonuclease domain-containing protein n=1 Tax=Pseudonocardia sp. TMWB2A TaxID=687430 RepID=UPI00307E7D3D
MDQDKNLLLYAAQMRKEPTPFEAKLWAYLSRSQLGGYKFRRQHVVDNFICDFFCPAKGLIIEVDGDTHDASRDERRDASLLKQGYSTLRFTNCEVGENIEGVLSMIAARLAQLPNRWSARPHPNPSPEGEGLNP